jgi:hypothetical protein
MTRKINDNIVNSRCYNHISINFGTWEFGRSKHEFEFEMGLDKIEKNKVPSWAWFCAFGPSGLPGRAAHLDFPPGPRVVPL